MTTIHFEQFELDDLFAALGPLIAEAVEERIVYSDKHADEIIVGYDVVRPPLDMLRVFAERAVEIADKNRARTSKKDLTANSI